MSFVTLCPYCSQGRCEKRYFTLFYRTRSYVDMELFVSEFDTVCQSSGVQARWSLKLESEENRLLKLVYLNIVSETLDIGAYLGLFIGTDGEVYPTCKVHYTCTHAVGSMMRMLRSMGITEVDGLVDEYYRLGRDQFSVV